MVLFSWVRGGNKVPEGAVLPMHIRALQQSIVQATQAAHAHAAHGKPDVGRVSKAKKRNTSNQSDIDSSTSSGYSESIRSTSNLLSASSNHRSRSASRGSRGDMESSRGRPRIRNFGSDDTDEMDNTRGGQSRGRSVGASSRRDFEEYNESELLEGQMSITKDGLLETKDKKKTKKFKIVELARL
jgi:hypothetical protein